MKKLLILFFAITFQCILIAQHIPQGMQYQAVARDLEGQILADQQISLKIKLISNQDREQVVHYEELHHIKTSELGLFDLVIGEGVLTEGELSEIPWSDQQIYMELAIDAEGGRDFKVINTSRLLTVPYAFHAGTADGITETTAGSRGNGPGVPANNWHLKGNRSSDPTVDKLGTTDCADLVIVTDNEERMRILCSGQVLIDGALDVGSDLTVQQNVEVNIMGGTTTVRGDLSVVDGSNTYLSGDLVVDGTTNLNSSLDVNNNSPTNLTGLLNVDGTTDLNSSLDVNNNSPTNLTGLLNVDGTTDLNSSLDVNNNSPTNLTGSLNVDGTTDLNSSLDVNNNSPTNLTGSLNVDGITDLNSSLDVNNNSPTNLTGSLDVDGMSNLNSSLDVNNNAPTNLTGILNVVGITTLNNNFNVTNNGISLLTGPTTVQNTLNVSNDGTFDTNLSVGDNFSVTNCLQSGSSNRVLFKFNPNIINSAEGSFSNYPLQISGAGHSQGVAIRLNQWAPNHNFVAFFAGGEMRGRIEGKNNFLFNNLSTVTQNLLTYDPNDAQGSAGGADSTVDATGAVADAGDTNVPTSGIAVAEANTEEIVDLVILSVNFIGSIIGVASSFTSIPFDPVDIFEAALGAIVAGADLGIFIGFGVANVGVAYESGSGDYAEYLLKYNTDEVFNYGEVVGVIGGQISKEFGNADKYMVISAAPAVSGAMPQPDEEENYEQVAFIGQVPVKVRGEVLIGDYILPSGDGDGLAIAVAPDEMKAKDYPRIIGTAWQNSDPGEHVKIYQMINTAVGINHNDMADMMEQMQVVINQMQEAIKEMNPDYEGFVFETESDVVDLKNNYSVSTTNDQIMEGYFDGIKYESREELGEIVAEAIEVQTGVDLDEYPVVQRMLLDPEYAEAAKVHYSQLLDEYLVYMEQLKQD